MERRRRTGWTGRPRPRHASTHGRSTAFSAATLVVSSTQRLFPSRILPQIKPISGRKHAELNRQIRGVEHLVTYRKQTATTCSNRQKIQKWTSAFPLVSRRHDSSKTAGGEHISRTSNWSFARLDATLLPALSARDIRHRLRAHGKR